MDYAQDADTWQAEPWSSVSTSKLDAVERARARLRHLASILVTFPHICAVRVVDENGNVVYADSIQLGANIVKFLE